MDRRSARLVGYGIHAKKRHSNVHFSQNDCCMVSFKQNELPLTPICMRHKSHQMVRDDAHQIIAK